MFLIKTLRRLDGYHWLHKDSTTYESYGLTNKVEDAIKFQTRSEAKRFISDSHKYCDRNTTGWIVTKENQQ